MGVTIAVVSVSVVVAVVIASVTVTVVFMSVPPAAVAVIFVSVPITVVVLSIPPAAGRRRRRVFPDGRRRDFAPLVVFLSTFWPGHMTCRLVISRGGCFRVNSRYCFFLLMELISFEESSNSPPR